ncbi:LacI family DNA-binding transcriptional regulator [Mailhella massiliensis]|uniref:LacI family transcriptional regulator n=1 Tax=Mailhella massiliensis TaxID=1903261 RepID=A0A921AWM3_9BACT|nr:LacI family DNA-binding transcriptional regulator [Mailhella massiliensis]HJD97680.1 LacI family transcriptional regulator [Mailhella massiliensis]
MKIKKKVTLEDVSQAAGVSLSSVSMILNARADVSFSPETVRKVRSAAESLGYRAPARLGKGRLPGRNVVFIVTPNIANAYYSGLVQAIQQAAEESGFSTLIFTTYREARKEEEVLDMALALGAAGMIFTLTPQSIRKVEKVNVKIPIVVMGDRNSSPRVDTVELDNYSAGVLIGRHMLELGHRHIAFISAMTNTANAIRLRRLQGVRDTYAEMPGCSVQVFTRDYTPHEELGSIDLEQQIGYELTMLCLKKKSHVSGFVAVNDFIAYGVLDALAGMGLRVPEDYSVCGFNNLSSSRISHVGLTTVEHQTEAWARNAVGILCERMKGGNAVSDITRVAYAHRLLERRSTAPFRPSSQEKS